MNNETKARWDRAAARYDFMTGVGPEKRWGPYKRELFAHMSGRILFLALGTGLDIRFFPPDQNITAIDISPKMLAQAADRIAAYPGHLQALEMDVCALEFDDHSFDQVYTSCTFCSVPDPVLGLSSLRRVLRPDGELRMFEHTGSRWFPFRQMLSLMTPVTRQVGPDISRPTVANVAAAGFEIREVKCVYLDVVKTIYAVAPG